MHGLRNKTIGVEPRVRRQQPLDARPQLRLGRGQLVEAAIAFGGRQQRKLIDDGLDSLVFPAVHLLSLPGRPQPGIRFSSILVTHRGPPLRQVM